LHEIAHVVLAAAPAGKDPLAIAMLAKLGRVFLLVPLCFLFIFWMKKRAKGSGNSEAKVDFPWFLVGFMIMSLTGSYVIENLVDIPPHVITEVENLSSFVLTMAMVGLGLNVSFKALRTKALRPLIAMTITSVLLSIVTFVML
jgi:uncharacterized membrane protein YadS